MSAFETVPVTVNQPVLGRTDGFRGVAVDPRVERTKAHVLEAARSLLAERGADSVTFATVGLAARVARQTLYRHWATRDELIDELMLDSIALERPRPADLTPEMYLAAFLGNVCDYVNSPAIARAFALLISQATVADQSAETLLRMVERGMGVLQTGWGPLSVDDYAMIVGPVLLKLLVLRQPITAEFLSRITSDAVAHREVDQV